MAFEKHKMVIGLHLGKDKFGTILHTLHQEKFHMDRDLNVKDTAI